MYSAYGMGELAVAPLDVNYASAVTAMQFSPHHEALWAGTDSGHIYTLQCPSLHTFAHWQAHPTGPVLEVLAAGDGVLSLSQHRLALHGLGGAPRWCINNEAGHFTALCLEGGGGGAGGGGGGGGGGGSGGRAVLGRSGPLMSLVDLATAKVVVEQELSGLLGNEGITLLRGPVNRGSLCCATSMGRLALIDPRAKLRADSAIIAAPGGVAALDARGDTVAAAGYGLRAGSVLAENCVKIFDLRAGLRLLYSLPTAGPPAALSFHPLLPNSLLVALPSALFCLADTATGAASSVCQADMASDSLSTATLSPSGELVALGGSGGYVHLWGDMGGGGGLQRVNKAATSAVPSVPPARPRPVVELQEDDCFAAAPQYPPQPAPGAAPGAAAAASLASDCDPLELTVVGLPPRVMDPALRKDMRVVNGVGYLPNPHYSRAKPLADMVRELAPMRHGPGARLSMKADWVDPAAARAERQRQRAADGGVVLPLRYQYVEIRHYGRLKWEEFDFSYYNRTRFAGLENDLPNAYCNALLQALYFVPEFRCLVLSHIPEPDTEFCLSCELSFLFTMLQRSVGLPCQATNLLRTLRSLREAAALGLLDGGGIGPAAGDAGGAATSLGSGGAGSSETELTRRVAALSRFVLEQMHRDATNARTPSNGPFRSGVAPQPAPANASIASALEGLMGVSFLQRMTCLTGAGNDSVRDSRVFQVDLQYPASREKAARAAEEAKQLGLNRLPGAAPAVEEPPGTVPTFAELLRRSLLAATATRAWVDGARGYTLVRKVRVPVALPPLLTINVAAADSDEAAWWLPAKGPDGAAPPGEANRLPWAIAVISKPQTWEVEVHQADTAEQLYEQLGTSLADPGVVSGVYELCCAIFQIRDLDEAADPGVSRPGSKPHQGHLVTIVKVPQQYWDEIPEPRLTKLPPGSMAEFVTGRQQQTNGKVPPRGPTTTTAVTATATTAKTTTASATTTGAGTAAATSTTSGGATTTAMTVISTAPSVPPAAAAATVSGFAGNVGGGIFLPDDLDDIFASGLSLGKGDSSPSSKGSSQGGAAAKTTVAGSGPKPQVEAATATTAVTATSRPSSGGSGSAGQGQGQRGQSGGSHPARGHPQGPEWVLFNDFSVSPNCPPHEVTATYANQKLPCLLQYRQVPPPPHLTACAPAASPPATSSPSAAAAAAPAAAAVGKAAPPPQSSTPSVPAPTPTPIPTSTASAAASAAGGAAGGSGSPTDGGRQQGASPCSPAAAAGAPGAGTATTASLGSAAAAGGGGRGPGSAVGAGSALAVVAGGGGSSTSTSTGLSPEQFKQLCSSPPLQGPMAGLPPFRFKPLDMIRMGPRPGIRFAIDAEFVASSAPESRAVERIVAPPIAEGSLGVGGGMGGVAGMMGGAGGGSGGSSGLLVAPHQHQHQHLGGGGGGLMLPGATPQLHPPYQHHHAGGMDLVQLKQSRLTLARVAVVFAEPGPLAGSCCLDDYIRAVEPVYDYLTRWSGILPGDLDPAVSRHYTTTLKHTYLKLKYLLDCGCVFVGHDLRKDFRCINMVVPPEQVVDTSELFRHRGGRKLSLRFLASYLLGASMQGAGGGGGLGGPGGGAAGGGGAGGGGGPAGHHGVHGHGHHGPHHGGHHHGHGGHHPGHHGGPHPPQQLLGHDAIEDARMAMRLYHKYLELTANDSFHRVLNEMYAWGKQYGWEPVTLRNGVPQQPAAA